MTLRGKVHRTTTTLIALLLALALGGLLPATPADAAPRYSCDRGQAHAPKAGVSTILSGPGSNRYENAILRHICHTPRGAYIRVVTWSFTSTRIADALVAAHKRGAVVRVLMPKGQAWTRKNNRTVPRSTAVSILDKGLTGSSWLRTTGLSARGANVFDGKKTTLHQKTFQFSTTGSARRVSIIASGNPTENARTSQWTDAIQLVGNEKAYDWLTKLFDQQTADKARKKPFKQVRRGGVGFTAGPWNAPTMTDPVVRRIQQVPAHARLRIAVSAWQGPRGIALARAVAAHERADPGRDVWVLASKPFAPEVRAILESAGSKVYNGHFVKKKANGTKVVKYHHHKFMTARWRGADGKPQKRVWAGSENWSDNARGTDELVVEVRKGKVHDRYVKFFDRIAARN